MYICAWERERERSEGKNSSLEKSRIMTIESGKNCHQVLKNRKLHCLLPADYFLPTEYDSMDNLPIAKEKKRSFIIQEI